MKAKIRCMKKDDTEEIYRIQNLRYPFGNDIHVAPRPYERVVKDYEKLAKDDKAFPLVAEVKKKVVGYSIVHVWRGRSRHVGFINFSVDPNYVKSVAKALLQASIDTGRRINLVKLFTEILDGMDEVQKFLEKFGFKTETRRRKAAFFKRKFVDCIGMGLILREVK